MSIFVDRNTRVLVQGITGSAGGFHAEQMIAYGTQVVGRRHSRPRRHAVPAVRPDLRHGGGRGPGDRRQRERRVRPAAARGRRDPRGAPAPGIPLVVAITEGIPDPRHGEGEAVPAGQPGVRLLGPNCPGVITPGQCKIGIMPGHIHQPGPVGIVSRSGTLTYEAVKQLTSLGLGQSTAVGIGGDPVHGLDFVDCL